MASPHPPRASPCGAPLEVIRVVRGPNQPKLTRTQASLAFSSPPARRACNRRPRQTALLSWGSSRSPPPPFNHALSTPGPRLRGPSACRHQPYTSRSTYAVSLRPDGFLQLIACRSVAPCTRSWGSRPFGRRATTNVVTLTLLASPLPFKDFPSSAAAPRHHGRCPLSVCARTQKSRSAANLPSPSLTKSSSFAATTCDLCRSTS